MSSKGLHIQVTFPVFFMLFCLIFPINGFAKDAFGSPGVAPYWTSAKKTHIGTSFNQKNSSNKSLVWFTVADGVLTETYFPTIDTAQIRDSQILVSDNKSFFYEEKSPEILHSITEITPSLSKVVNTDKQNRFKIEHIYYTSANKSILYDEVTVYANQNNLSFYLLTNPYLNNSGYGDSAYINEAGFYFKEQNTALQVTNSVGFRKKSVGFVGYSDGWQDLNKDFKMDFDFTSALNGNVASTGEINIPASAGVYKFYIAYDFTSRGVYNGVSLPKEQKVDLRNFTENDYLGEMQQYSDIWDSYLNKISTPKGISEIEKKLYLKSIYALKVHEDKLTPGAIIASISIPWGDTLKDSQNGTVGGYHLVWPRDLFHISFALLLAGDTETPLDALHYLKKIQYKSTAGKWEYSPLRTINKEGAFPQNTWISGEDYWSGFQLDQVGYPVHLFYQIYKRSTPFQQQALIAEFSPMIIKALNFIKNYGPWSAQERWEENFGISPSTFAVATSALLIGEKLFQNLPISQQWGDAARGWLTNPGDNIDTWTFTNKGKYPGSNYYLRFAGCSGYDGIWNPNSGEHCSIANSTQRIELTKIIDQGFLQLSLLGLKSAADPKMKMSNEVIKQNILVNTPKGSGIYRYSYDAYGEESRGRLWPLLNGEQGRYAIERYTAGDLNWTEAKNTAQSMLNTLINFANIGQMIPEQVFESTGEGTGSATPLAWSHAEYVKLIWSINKQENVENPLN